MADTPKLDGVAPLWRPESTNNEYNQMTYLIKRLLSGVNVATLVQVVSAPQGIDLYPADFVDVKPLVAMTDGAGNAKDHGVIHRLPFLRIQGGHGAFVADPVVGDIGIALFCDRDISNVKRTSKNGPPGSQRRFSMSDGVYLGGWGNLSSPTTYYWVQGGFAMAGAPTGMIFDSPYLDLRQTGSVLQIENTQVVAKRQPTVVPPTGGGTVDTQARTAINDLINRLQTHGLIS